MAASLVDSHCHIPLIKADPSLVVAAAQENGVQHMLCVSVDLETFPEVAAVARQFDCVHASVGVHPNAVVAQEPAVDRLASLAELPRVLAIGETGLDYFRSHGDLEWQRQRFRNHIRAAREARKPLIVHSREARADVLDLLEEERASEIGGVMHCFVDDWESAARAMDLGFYISFSGIVTFRNAAALQQVAKRVPPDRLLVETDSPYLAPVPLRGKENQPAYVRHVAEFLATLRGESIEDLARATTGNFFRLFGAAA